MQNPRTVRSQCATLALQVCHEQCYVYQYVNMDHWYQSDGMQLGSHTLQHWWCLDMMRLNVVGNGRYIYVCHVCIKRPRVGRWLVYSVKCSDNFPRVWKRKCKSCVVTGFGVEDGRELGEINIMIHTKWRGWLARTWKIIQYPLWV